MADIWRTRFGERRTADTWLTQGGHVTDKLRRRGQSISRPAFFILRENPTVAPYKLFGEQRSSNTEDHPNMTSTPSPLCKCQLLSAIGSWHSEFPPQAGPSSLGGQVPCSQSESPKLPMRLGRLHFLSKVFWKSCQAHNRSQWCSWIGCCEWFQLASDL